MTLLSSERSLNRICPTVVSPTTAVSGYILSPSYCSMLSSGLAGKSLYLSALKAGRASYLHQLRIVSASLMLNGRSVHHLLNHKTTWIEITIETTIGGGELQNAVVRVGYTTGIVLLVAIAPNHLLALSIRQYLHCAF